MPCDISTKLELVPKNLRDTIKSSFHPVDPTNMIRRRHTSNHGVLNESGGVSLLVIGLIGSLILMLAIPYLSDMSDQHVMQMNEFCYAVKVPYDYNTHVKPCSAAGSSSSGKSELPTKGL